LHLTAKSNDILCKCLAYGGQLCSVVVLGPYTVLELSLGTCLESLALEVQSLALVIVFDLSVDIRNLLSGLFPLCGALITCFQAIVLILPVRQGNGLRQSSHVGQHVGNVHVPEVQQ